MNSHEALLEYPNRPLICGRRLTLDLFPAIQQSHGESHNAFVRWFNLVETREVTGLKTLRREVSLDSFISFLGGTWSDAMNRWVTLQWMNEYRDVHGHNAYTQLDAWEIFYELLANGIAPTLIEVSFVEHY